MFQFLKRSVITFFCIISFCLAFNPAKASHVTGGDLTYYFISQNEVILQAQIYRDCAAISLTGDPFKLSACGGTASKVNLNNMSFGVDITPTCTSTCTTCKSSSCGSGFGMQEYTLLSYLDLSSSSCCSYTFSWEQCCRDANITTGAAGENFYLEASFNKCADNSDESRGFEFKPLFYVCTGQCISVFNSADILNHYSRSNKDSISYELAQPLKDKSTAIGYVGGYSYQSPLVYEDYPNASSNFSSNCSGFHFNKATGELNFKAKNQDITIIAVKAIIWQKNSAGFYYKIGSFARDVRMVIQTCTSNTAPVIKGMSNITGNTAYVEAGKTIEFTVDASDPDKDTVTLASIISIPNLTIKKSSVKSLNPQDTFTFSPSVSQISDKPYSIIFTVKDNVCPLPAINQKIFYFKVVSVWPKIEISRKDSSCGSVYLSSTTASSLGLKYKWLINGKVESDQQNFLYQPITNREYRVKLELIAGNGSSKTIYDTFTTVNIVNADAGKDTGICTGGSVQLSASGGTKYKWTPSYGLSSDTAQNPVASPDSTLTYYVEVTDAKGCKGSDSVTVLVTDFDIQVSKDTAVCAGNNRFISIKAFAPDAVRFLWKPNINMFDSTIAETYVRPTVTTTYTVYATNNYGCTKSKSVTVFINKPVADAGTDKEICLGDSVQLHASGGSVYTWNAASGISQANIPNPWVKPSTSQSYIVRVRDSAGCSSSSDTVFVKVNKISTSIFGDTTICKGDTAIIGITGGNKYKWLPATNISSVNSATVKVYPASSTKYYVLATDTITGCKKYDSVSVTVVTDCIYPGDANDDKTADYLDILNIAVGYGTKGTARVNSTTDWKAQNSKKWTQNTASGTNYKYLDCNGDGIIDASDTLAVVKNYGKTHNKNETPQLAGNPNDPPLYFQFQQDTFYAGDTVIVSIYLGNKNKPMNSAYGIAMKYFYDDAYMVPGSYKFSWVCDKFCDDKNKLSLYKQFGTSASAEGTIARTDKKASGPEGAIANIIFVLKDTNYNYPQQGDYIGFHFQNTRVINNYGKILNVFTSSDSIKILRVKEKEIEPQPDGIKPEPISGLKIYPNPAKNKIFIENRKHFLEEVYMVNVLGETVRAIKPITATQTEINIADLPQGVYFIKVRAQNHFSTHKIIVVR
jgi:hypothetical protein